MSIISIVGFLVLTHSAFIFVLILVNPSWYEKKAAASGVRPNIGMALFTKVIIGGLGAAVGFYFL